MKKVLIGCFVVFIFYGATLAHAEGNVFLDFLDQFFEKKLYKTDEEVRHVRLAGVDLWIPHNYKMGPYDTKELEQDAVLLQVLLPELEPRTEENKSQFTEGLGWGNRARILLKDVSDTTDMQERYQITLTKIYPKQIPQPDIYGLQSQIVTRFDPTKMDERARSRFEEKMYFSLKDNRVERYITCRHLAENPGCAHHFMMNEVFVTLSYRMTYLENWEALENKVKNLITEFKTKPPQEVSKT